MHYPVPCHRQPAFAAYATGSLPVAEAAATLILSLPLHPALTAAQVGDVCTVLGRPMHDASEAGRRGTRAVGASRQRRDADVPLLGEAPRRGPRAAVRLSTDVCRSARPSSAAGWQALTPDEYSPRSTVLRHRDAPTSSRSTTTESVVSIAAGRSPPPAFRRCCSCARGCSATRAVGGGYPGATRPADAAPFPISEWSSGSQLGSHTDVRPRRRRPRPQVRDAREASRRDGVRPGPSPTRSHPRPRRPGGRGGRRVRCGRRRARHGRFAADRYSSRARTPCRVRCKLSTGYRLVSGQGGRGGCATARERWPRRCEHAAVPIGFEMTSTVRSCGDGGLAR